MSSLLSICLLLLLSHQADAALGDYCSGWVLPEADIAPYAKYRSFQLPETIEYCRDATSLNPNAPTGFPAKSCQGEWLTRPAFADESSSGGMTTEQKYLCTISKIAISDGKRSYIGVSTEERTAGWLDGVQGATGVSVSFDRFVTTDSEDGDLVYYLSLTKSERGALLGLNGAFATIQPTINDLKISPTVDAVGECDPNSNPYPLVRVIVHSSSSVNDVVSKIAALATANPSLCSGSCGGGAGCQTIATGDSSFSKLYGNEVVVTGVNSPSAFAAALIGEADLEEHIISVTSDMPTIKDNTDAAWIIQSGNRTDVKSHTPFWDRGITGAGVTVGVADSGLDHQSCYFYDSSAPVSFSNNVVVGGQSIPIHENIASRKVVQYVGYAGTNEGENGGHGTHVAGSISGNNEANDAVHNGMAYGSKVAFFDIGEPNAQYLNVPGSLSSDMFPHAKRVGANIHSNSWGSDTNSYTGGARQIDAYTFDNQDFLVLVAAGNSGGDGSSQFPGSLGSPATSKNCLSVGATENEDVAGSTGFADNDLAYFSSRGPAYDGRIKPDLVAPGYFIKSANSVTNPIDGHCSAIGMRGTSMATPVTAGAAALVQEYFEDGFYPKGVRTNSDAFKPMGALVKAVLINGAQRIVGGTNANFQGSSWPNMDQGHGVVELDATLNFNDVFKGQGLYARGDFNNMVDTTFADSTDPPVEVKFKSTGADCVAAVNSPEKQFRATLSWFDYPASSSSSRSLVNDLDIIVTGSDGSTHYPNGGTGRDSLNNVESVVFTPTKDVEYTVKISADTVTSGPQPYAYVISGCFESPDRPNDSGGVFGGSISDLPWAEIGMAVGCIAGVALIVGLAVIGVRAFGGRAPKRAGGNKGGAGYKANNHRRSSATARRSGGGSFTTGTGFLGQGRTGSSAKSGAHKPQIEIGLGNNRRASGTKSSKTKYHGKVSNTFNSKKWDNMV